MSARELADLLRERQREAQRTGCCAPGVHDLLRGPEAMLADELDLPAFVAVVAELAAGCPASAWCFAARAVAGARARELLGEAAPAELCGGRIATAAAGDASAHRDGSGWRVSGAFPRAVGARAATHFLGRARSEDEPGAVVTFIAGPGQFSLRDGVGGSCAASVALEDALVPALAHGGEGAVETYRTALAPAALAAVHAGAAAAASESYEASVRGPAALDADRQRALGAALARASAAGLLIEAAAAEYAAQEAGHARDLRLGAIAREASRYGWEAVVDALRCGGDERLELIASALLRCHGESDPLSDEDLARRLARERLGVATAP